jgi:MFS family permease
MDAEDRSASDDSERAWKWFCASYIAVGACGVSYAFSAFSGALKAEWSLSQSELETISVSGNIAVGVFGGLGGMLVDVLSPRRSMALGGLMLSLAYGTFWAVATRTFPLSAVVPPVLALGSCVGVASMGGVLVMTTVITLMVRTLPAASRGVLIGLLKAYVGIASGGLAVTYQGVSGRALGGSEVRSLDVLLAVSIEMLVITQLPALFLPAVPMRALREAPTEPAASTILDLLRRRIEIVSACMGGILCALAVGAFVHVKGGGRRAHELVPHTTRAAIAAAFLLCWIAPALLTRSHRLVHALTSCGGRGVPTDPRASLDAPAGADPPPCAESLLATGSAAAEASPAAKPAPPRARREFEPLLPSASLFQMLPTLECWLIVFVMSTLFGSGLMISTNLGEILAAKGLSGIGLTGPALTLMSIGSAVGRLAGGFGADVLHARMGLPASGCLVADLCVMICAHVMFALAESSHWVLCAVFLAGAAFGASWPHVVLLIAECYGKEHMGANYGFYDGVCQAAGSLLLAKLLPGAVYAAHVREGNECFGNECFALTHAVIVGLSIAAAGAAALLTRAQVRTERAAMALGFTQLLEA